MIVRAILFLIFIVVPIIEIALFIIVGGVIGVLPTILLIVGTAVLGASLMRSQGLAVLNQIRAETEAGRVPGAQIGHGAMILLAGLLLLTPGFFTDALGFLLFVPQIRNGIWRRIRSSLNIVVSGPTGPMGSTRARPTTPPPVIDLDPEDYGRPRSNSPWRGPDNSHPTIH